MKKLWLLSFLVLLALLTGCDLGKLRLSSAMEESIAKQYVTVSDFRLQSQIPWQDGGLALVTFDAVNDRDMAFEDCYGIGYFRSLSTAYYTVFTSTSSCSNATPELVMEGKPAALATIPYGSLPLVRQDTTVAFGKVNHFEGTQVRVDWRDGQSETVDVINQFYLAPRKGLSEVKETILLNEDGGLLASVEP